MIIRVEHKQRFTVIADGALRDKRLSFRATGVLAYLLSLPDGTDVSGRRLCQAKKEGRDATLVALKELEEAGYLTRQRYQNPADGRWTTLCIVEELPSENPTPSPGFQGSDIQDSVNQDVKAFEVPEMNTKSFKGADSQESASWAPHPTPPKGLDAETRARGAEFMRAVREGLLPDKDDKRARIIKELEPLPKKPA
jgi:hypothetical protein